MAVHSGYTYPLMAPTTMGGARRRLSHRELYDLVSRLAQAMRAVLFAKATATTKRGLRARKAISQGSTLPALDRSITACAPLTSRRLR